MTAVSVLSDIACHLGEGPTYDPATDTFFWFDIREKKLLEKHMPDGAVKVHDLPVMASALAVIDRRATDACRPRPACMSATSGPAR